MLPPVKWSTIQRKKLFYIFKCWSTKSDEVGWTCNTQRIKIHTKRLLSTDTASCSLIEFYQTTHHVEMYQKLCYPYAAPWEPKISWRQTYKGLQYGTDNVSVTYTVRELRKRHKQELMISILHLQRNKPHEPLWWAVHADKHNLQCILRLLGAIAQTKNRLLRSPVRLTPVTKSSSNQTGTVPTPSHKKTFLCLLYHIMTVRGSGRGHLNKPQQLLQLSIIKPIVTIIIIITTT